jgi:hypothetical protein
MEKVISILSGNLELIAPIVLFILGIFIPKEKVFSLGKVAGQKLPKSVTIKMAEYLDSIEQGLLEATHNGDKAIVSNNQVSDAVKKVKIDLGLEESVSKKME